MAKQKKDYQGHRERLKKKFNKTGLKSLQDYEIIELLLNYPIPQRDVKPVAKELLKKLKK